MIEGATLTSSSVTPVMASTVRVSEPVDASALSTSTTTLGRAALGAERLLPVAAPLQPLLPGGGLRRGRAVAVRGAAALSLAIALGAEASRAGSWMAIVGSPAGRGDGRRAGRGDGALGAVADLGVEAATGLGVALERVVRITVEHGTDGGTGDGIVDSGFALRWADAMAAVLDGFEVVITAVPASAALVRKVQRRLTQREAAVIVVGDAGALDVDVELRGRGGAWEGLDDGAGHLRRRRIDVSASGRRMPRPARAELWLPAADGRLAAPAALGAPAASLDVAARSALAHGSSDGVLERLLLDPELDVADVDDTEGRGVSRVG